MATFPKADWIYSYSTLNKMNQALGLDVTEEIKPVVWRRKGVSGDFLRIDLSQIPTVHVECFEGFDPRLELAKIIAEPGARRKGERD